MTKGIFLIRKDGQAVEMKCEPYDSEELIQRLLADHPSLMAGYQVNGIPP